MPIVVKIFPRSSRQVHHNTIIIITILMVGKSLRKKGLSDGCLGPLHGPIRQPVLRVLLRVRVVRDLPLKIVHGSLLEPVFPSPGASSKLRFDRVDRLLRPCAARSCQGHFLMNCRLKYWQLVCTRVNVIMLSQKLAFCQDVRCGDRIAVS